MCENRVCVPKHYSHRQLLKSLSLCLQSHWNIYTDFDRKLFPWTRYEYYFTVHCVCCSLMKMLIFNTHQNTAKYRPVHHGKYLYVSSLNSGGSWGGFRKWGLGGAAWGNPPTPKKSFKNNLFSQNIEFENPLFLLDTPMSSTWNTPTPVGALDLPLLNICSHSNFLIRNVNNSMYP